MPNPATGLFSCGHWPRTNAWAAPWGKPQRPKKRKIAPAPGSWQGLQPSQNQVPNHLPSPRARHRPRNRTRSTAPQSSPQLSPAKPQALNQQLNQYPPQRQRPTTPNPNCLRFKSWNLPQRSRRVSPRTGVANWQAWTFSCNGWVGPVTRKVSIWKELLAIPAETDSPVTSTSWPISEPLRPSVRGPILVTLRYPCAAKTSSANATNYWANCNGMLRGEEASSKNISTFQVVSN